MAPSDHVANLVVMFHPTSLTPPVRHNFPPTVTRSLLRVILDWWLMIFPKKPTSKSIYHFLIRFRATEVTKPLPTYC
jgi:hypothetical protein